MWQLPKTGDHVVSSAVITENANLAAQPSKIITQVCFLTPLRRAPENAPRFSHEGTEQPVTRKTIVTPFSNRRLLQAIRLLHSNGSFFLKKLFTGAFAIPQVKRLV